MNAPTTSDFLPEHAFPADDERVQRQMTLRISFYMRHPELIGIRLRQLDREWNIERFMEKKTAVLAAVDTSTRTMRSKRWFTLTAPMTNLLQNTVQGWSLPIQTLRNLGYRTRDQIEQERQELLTLRDLQSSRPKRVSSKRRSKPSSKQSKPSSKKSAKG
jgi:hypothetical protein